MRKISGYFVAHGFWWHRRFANIISETQKTFSGNKGINIVMLENIGFDPSWAKEIFIRSAKEKDLVKLWAEGYLKRYGSTDEYLFFKKKYSMEVKKNLLNSSLNDGQRRLSLYEKLSDLRKKVSFRVLMESGMTEEIKLLMETQKESKKNALVSFACDDYCGYKNNITRATELLIQISDKRDLLVREVIDSLFREYQDICIQIVFGNLHSPVLDSYIEMEDIISTLTMDYTAGDQILFLVYNKIRSGEILIDSDINAYLTYQGIGFLSEKMNQYSRNLEMHPGRVMEILNCQFSSDWHEKFLFNKTVFPGAGVIGKALYFLFKSGALDLLESEFPNEVKFCKSQIEILTKQGRLGQASNILS